MRYLGPGPTTAFVTTGLLLLVLSRVATEMISSRTERAGPDVASRDPGGPGGPGDSPKDLS
jgi:hypothetical protein